MPHLWLAIPRVERELKRVAALDSFGLRRRPLPLLLVSLRGGEEDGSRSKGFHSEDSEGGDEEGSLRGEAI